MQTAFPSPDYYGPSAPSPSRQPTVGLPDTDLAGRWVGRLGDGSYVHCAPLGRMGVQLFPCGLATATPQAFTVASWSAHRNRRPSCLPNAGRYAPLAGPYPPDWSRFLDEGGSTTGSLSLHLSTSLDGPRLSGSANPSRRCQGCLPPDPSTSWVRLPSASTGCCDSPKAVSFHHRSDTQRLIAHQCSKIGKGISLSILFVAVAARRIDSTA
jgi:hypothetical protein